MDLVANSTRYDTVLISGDSFLKSQAAKIMATLRQTDLKVVANSKDYLRQGALFGVVADFYTIGQRCGDILLRVQSGEDITQIPIGSIRTPELIINQDTATRLNIDIPTEMEQEVRFITPSNDDSS